MKTTKAIPVNDITQLCDCLDNRFSRFSEENSLAFDVNGVNSETKTKIRTFLKGFAYAHDGELNVSENIYSITVKESNSYIHCKYSVKKLGTYENTVCTQTDLYLAADALVRGEKSIIDLSNAEDSVAFFQFLSGVATESDAAVGGHHIHASVSVVDGHLVVLDPVGVLAADHEVHELVQQCAADVGVSDV